MRHHLTNLGALALFAAAMAVASQAEALSACNTEVPLCGSTPPVGQQCAIDCNIRTTDDAAPRWVADALADTDHHASQLMNLGSDAAGACIPRRYSTLEVTWDVSSSWSYLVLDTNARLCDEGSTNYCSRYQPRPIDDPDAILCDVPTESDKVWNMTVLVAASNVTLDLNNQDVVACKGGTKNVIISFPPERSLSDITIKNGNLCSASQGINFSRRFRGDEPCLRSPAGTNDSSYVITPPPTDGLDHFKLVIDPNKPGCDATRAATALNGHDNILIENITMNGVAKGVFGGQFSRGFVLQPGTAPGARCSFKACDNAVYLGETIGAIVRGCSFEDTRDREAIAVDSAIDTLIENNSFENKTSLFNGVAKDIDAIRFYKNAGEVFREYGCGKNLKASGCPVMRPYGANDNIVRFNTFNLENRGGAAGIDVASRNGISYAPQTHLITGTYTDTANGNMIYGNRFGSKSGVDVKTGDYYLHHNEFLDGSSLTYGTNLTQTRAHAVGNLFCSGATEQLSTRPTGNLNRYGNFVVSCTPTATDITTECPGYCSETAYTCGTATPVGSWHAICDEALPGAEDVVPIESLLFN